MNYIYDIFLNFDKEIIDFYDWNNGDKVTHIRKIPVFKIRSDSIHDLYCGKIKFQEDFLKIIENKTEVFMSRDLIKIPYCSLFTDGNTVLSLKLDNKGTVIEKSVLLIQEELEVIDFCERMNIFNINYEITKKDFIIDFKTRYEKYLYNFLKNQINNLDKKNDLAKLKYLYYECFNTKERDKEKIINSLTEYLNRDWDKAKVKLNDFFRLTTKLKEEKV